MHVQKSETISTFKRYFLFRLLARCWWLIDLLAFIFAPVFFLLVCAAVHVALYRLYLLSFVRFSECFVYLKNEDAGAR